MKLNKKFKWIAAVAGAVIVIALVLVLWNPPFISSIFKTNDYTPVNVSAADFASGAGKTLEDAKARLIVVNDFHATKLNNDRPLHIYLPPSYYKDTDKKYPVLYVHDGKSVFDISDWSKESLNMHTQADKLISDGKIEEIIIVGIDNIGEERTSEYALWDGIDQGKPVTGKGELHEDFLLNEVKPFIDKNFRTLTDREHTALMGCSIGGFSTFNTAFRNPDMFSKIAMLSPYLGWGDNKLYGMISDGPYKEKQTFKIWIDVGSKEEGFVDMAAQGILMLLNNGYTYGNDLIAYEAPDGEHSEKFWSQRVESILLYFYGDIGKPQSVTLYTDGQLSLSDSFVEHINAVVTYDSGFKMTDFGTYEIQNPDILGIADFGGALQPKAEGSTEVTFTSASGLTAKTTITVVK